MTEQTIKPAQSIDKILLMVVLILMTFGIVMIFSASQVIAERKFDNTFHFLLQQLLRVCLGFLILVVAAKYDYHNYMNKTMLFMLIAFILLIVVLGLERVKGASRWLSIGGFGIQPSEIAKLGLIFYLAAYLNNKGDRIRDFQNGLLPPLLIAGVFAFMIILQPNFSTAVVLMMMVLAVLFIGGMRMKHLLLLLGSLIPLAGILAVVSPYRFARLYTFMHPESDAQGMGYQIKQSLISFGNGGLFGVGLGEGKQKMLFLPEPFTDFIYSIIGEELGFIGAVAVLALFVVFLFRAVKIARTAPDLYGFYLAAGIIISIALYVVINAGVAVGIFPTTGLPMPFISYGGTSLLFTCFMIGVLLNISKQSVSKEEALKVIMPEGDNGERLSENFNVYMNADENPAGKAYKKTGTVPPQSAKNKKSIPSIVGMDFSD